MFTHTAIIDTVSSSGSVPVWRRSVQVPAARVSVDGQAAEPWARCAPRDTSSGRHAHSPRGGHLERHPGLWHTHARTTALFITHALGSMLQGPVSRVNPPLPEEYPKTAEPMLKRKGAVKPVRWHVHASTAPSNTYSAEAVAVLAGLKPAAAGNGATLGAAMALGRSPMSRPVTAPVLASSPLAALRKGGGSSRNNLLPRPGSVNTGLGQARGGAGVGIGAGAGVGAFAGSPLGGYPSRPATPETNVTGAAAAGADATAEDGAELRAKFSATAKRSSRRKLTKLGTSMRSIRLVGVGSGESPVGNRTQRNFDLLGGRTMRTGTSQLQMVANLLDQDSSR